MKRSILRYITVLGLLIFSFIIYSSKLSYADHSLGSNCYGCHNLKSSFIIVGSQSISSDETYLSSDPNGYIINTGRPFDCSFCHDADDDLPITKFTSALTTKEESSHPVDVIGDEDDIGTNEIVCADCHLLAKTGGTGYDIAPATMTTKDADDGYPNHKFVELDPDDPTNPTNYTPLYGGSDYPNDAINKAHLTKPYGKQTYTHAGPEFMSGIPDENRSVDWMDADITYSELLCFLCHADANYAATIPTFSGAWDDPAVADSSAYDIAAEYNNIDHQLTTAGHPIKTAGGELAVGSKLPCYNCHDTHGATTSITPPLNQNDKLILNEPTKYDNNSTFAVTTSYDWDIVNGDLKVCAGCHDTGLDSTATGGIVEGLIPVDPFDSVAWGELHSNSGVADGDMTASTIGCISIENSNGCHKNSHDPSTIDGPCDDTPCWWCHGGLTGTIVKVQDNTLDTWGRGGDFGTNNSRTSTTSLPADWISVHNIDFSAANTGEDGSLLPGRARGSCTVCHTLEERDNGKKYHGDGDPRNDFRDVDEGSEANEFAGASSEPVLISEAEGYRYDPPWLMCVDCHDNENNESTEEYFTIIGEGSAPLNLDEFFDVTPDSPEEFVYGSGDYLNPSVNDYDDVPAYIPDEIGEGGDGLNATPVSRYDLQPYKAHYYQRDSNDVVYTLAGGDEIPDNQTDPTNQTNYELGGTAERIINCLDCHYGHGSKNSFLYKSPKDPPDDDEIIFDGRRLCLDCHDEGVTAQWDRQFPTPDRIIKGGPEVPSPEPTRLMRAPPVTDRYLNTIDEHEISSGVSCANYKNVGNERVLFRCHNPHSPSCETCHSYPVDLLDVDHD